MKKKIFIAFIFLFVIATKSNLYAQENSSIVKSKSNIKNNKVSVIKLNSTEDGCSIVVGNEIVSSRDAASGMPTGKRMHKPFVITKELDASYITNKSSKATTAKDVSSGSASGKRVTGGPIGGIIVKGGKNPGGGQFNNIVAENGQFTLPADAPDGEYTMSLSWEDAPLGTVNRIEKIFMLTMENGVCKSITEKGIK